MPRSAFFEKVIREGSKEPPNRLFERVLREANGKASPTNAMSEYKKQNVGLEAKILIIEQKLIKAEPFDYYVYTGYDKFVEDYNKLYENKVFTTPLGYKVKMGKNQMLKLFCKDETKKKKKDKRNRTYLLNAIKEIIEDPIVIIWKPASKKEKEKGNQGVLLFAKSFIMNNDKIRAVNSITIKRDDMRIIISSHERTIEDIKDELKNPNRIVYIKK